MLDRGAAVDAIDGPFVTVGHGTELIDDATTEHLVADSSLPEYDPEYDEAIAEQVVERMLTFLDPI